MPAPPESLVRLLMERQQERGPDVGPMTEEEMRLYLSDPAHKQAMNVSLLCSFSCSIILFLLIIYVYVIGVLGACREDGLGQAPARRPAQWRGEC